MVDVLVELHSDGTVGVEGVKGVLLPEVRIVLDILNWLAASQ